METYEGDDFFNIGTGKENTIRGLAEMIKEVVGSYIPDKIITRSTKNLINQRLQSVLKRVSL